MDIDKMKTLVSAGKMGRRDFIQLSVAAGLTAAAGETLFSATARATPKKGTPQICRRPRLHDGLA